MGFTVEFNGVPVTCETLADVKIITEALRGSGKSLPTNGKQGDMGPANIQSVVRKLGPNAKKALRAVLKAENHRITDAHLCSALGLANNNALAGVLSSIPKEANKARVDVTTFFTKEESKDENRKRVVIFGIPQDVVHEVREALNG